MSNKETRCRSGFRTRIDTAITHPNSRLALAAVFVIVCLLFCTGQASCAQLTAPKEYANGDIQALTKNLSASPSLAKKAFADGMTLLHFAARDGNITAAKLLIGKGAAVNAKSTGNSDTPLTMARSLDMTKLLVESGADVNKATVSGRTPLIMAAIGYDRDLVEFLLGKGADVNAKCDLGSALTAAANRGKSAEIVKLLIVKGADSNIKDQSGTTPLEYARKRKNSVSPTDQSIVRLMEDAALGVDVSAIEAKDVFEPSQLFESARLGDVCAVLAILRHDRDLANACDALGATALHLAVDGVSDSVYTSTAVIKALLSSGANVNVAKNDGVTPLHVAAALGKLEAAKALLAGGAKPDLTDLKGRTPLSLAQDKKNKLMIELLSKPPKPADAVHQPPGTKAILSTETSLAGIQPGDTRADVERLYGPGSFQAGNDLDILSYSDPGSKAGLSVTLRKDSGIVVTIQLAEEQGAYFARPEKPFADTSTKAGIRLGSTRADIERAYGVEPGEDEPYWGYGFDMSGRWFVLGFGTVKNAVALIKLEGGKLK